MSDAEIVVSVRGDVSGGRVVKSTLDDIAVSGQKATTQQELLERQIKQTTQAANGFKNAFLALGGITTLIQISKISDEYVNLNSRVKNATRSITEQKAAWEGLRNISNQTGSSISDAVDVFQRLSFVRNEIKANVSEMVTFTGTVQKLGVISGASTEGMKAGLLQLGQAMSAGTVRAEEFNSVVENMPAVAKAIGDQFGVTTGQLRQLVLAGKVDSVDFFNAILNASAQVEEQYANMPMTIGRAFSQLQNEMQSFIGETSQASGAATVVIGVIDTLKIAVYGLGQVFNGLVSIVGTAFSLVLKHIQDQVNNVIKIVNFGIGYANKVPGVNIGLLKETNFAGTEGLTYSDMFKQGGVDLRNSINTNAPDTIIDKALGGQDLPTTSQGVKAVNKDYAELAKIVGGSSKAAKEALKAQKKTQDELNDAVKTSRTEQEKLYDTIKAQEALKPFAKTAEQAEAIRKNIANARTELQKLADEAELKSPVGKAFQSLASEIDDGFKDAFKSAFTESDGGFKKLLKGWKDTFKSFLADLAYQALARPIMVSIVGGVGGMMGLSSSSIASVLGTGSSSSSSGSGVGLGNISSLYGLLNGGLYSSTLAGWGSQAGFNFGTNVLGMGFEQAGNFSDLAGGALGNMGYGAIGGLGANLLGLGSKNSLVNFASGTLGSLAGGAIGTSMGTILGMAGGPAGAVIGSFLGTAIGGMFGGAKPSDKSQGGTLDLSSLTTTKYGQTGKKFSQENSDFRDAVMTEATSLVSMLKSVGGSTTGSLNMLIGNRDGLRLNGANYGNNSTAFVNAVMQTVVNGTTGITGTFKTILDKLGVSDLTKLQNGFTFGQSYNDTINPKSTADQLSDAIAALDTNMQSLIKTANDLGLPTTEYAAALEKQRDASVAALKAQTAGFQSLEDATNSFKSFLDGQALGSSSSMSPLDKLGLAQSNFDTLLKQAQGGDLSVSSSLLSSGNTLIDTARSTYSSSTSFALIEKFVRDSISNIAHDIGIPGYASGASSASAGLSYVGEQGKEIVRMRGGEHIYTAGETAGIMALSGNVATDLARTNSQVVAMQNENLEEARLSRKEMTNLRRQMERIANKLAVYK